MAVFRKKTNETKIENMNRKGPQKKQRKQADSQEILNNRSKALPCLSIQSK